MPGLVVTGAALAALLSADLHISREAAAGIVSNLWAESGIDGIQEKNPLIPGSLGGIGWAQWTGPRRVDFEAWSSARGLSPSSDEANYGFLVYELKSQYSGVLAQLRAGQLSPTQAANVVFGGYESGGDPRLEVHRPGHIALANDFANFTVRATGAPLSAVPVPTAAFAASPRAPARRHVQLVTVQTRRK